MDHPVVTEIGKDTLVVSAEDSKGHPFKITFYETRFEVAALSKEADLSWALELKVCLLYPSTLRWRHTGGNHKGYIGCTIPIE